MNKVHTVVASLSLALSAMWLAGTSTTAEAATCSASSSGSLNLYLADGCEFPEETEVKVFLDKAKGVTVGTGRVGKEDGAPVANLSSSTSLNIANGFATIKGSQKSNIGDLTFSIPGFTFGDLLFDVKLAKVGEAGNKQTAPLTVEGFSGDTSLGLLNFEAGELKSNANLSFMLLATTEKLTSVVISSVINGLNGIKQLRHFQVSGLQSRNEVPGPVPLPASLLLLLSGIVGLGALGRVKSRLNR